MNEPSNSPTIEDEPTPEREHVDRLVVLAAETTDSDPRRALEHAQEAHDLASANGYDAGLAAALGRLALLHRIFGEHEQARGDAQHALALFAVLKDESGRARAMTVLGRVQFVLGNHAEGLGYLFPALELAQAIGDREGEALALYELSYGYVLLEDHATALDFAQQALRIDRKLRDRASEARELNVVAVCQRELGLLDEALASARESLRIAREGRCRLVESLALSTLCEIYEQVGDFERAVEFCSQSLESGRELGFDTPQLTGLIRLGGACRKAGQIPRSIEHYQATLELAERVGNRKDVMTCHQALSELYEIEGELASALSHQRRYSEVREAIFNEAHDRKIQALEIRHRSENARKEAEIYQLRNVALEQEIADRKRAEDELRTYKDRLEDEVAQRTRELTEANERLRASEERYRTLYEDTPSMYFTVDEEGAVLSVNRFGAEQLGYRPEELLGTPVADVFVEEDRAAAAFHLAECLETPDEVFHWELRKVRKDGSRLMVRETARVADRDGRRVVLIVCEDITEQKRAEQKQARLEAELRQAQKLEAVGRLAGGVAHDFNNLLTAMTGYLELVVGALDPGSPVRQDAEEARRTVDRAASLTNQLLAFSRRQPIRPAALDLNELVLDLEKLLRRLIGEDIELVTVLDPELARVYADRGQLEQVVVNLAANARDAMPRGGKLVIETANGGDGDVAAAGAGPGRGPRVLLSVTDTGSGMDEATRTRMFEPFFTTKEQGKGTGLGLSMVYGIVEQHHGWITVGEGSGGVGTAVCISLPQAGARATGFADADAGTAGAVDSRRGSETLLLVEDDELIRSLAARVLGDNGYTVIVARDAHEAVALASERSGDIQLALSDVVMPGISGYEFAEHLHAHHPEIRLVLMSGYDEPFADQPRPEGAPPILLSKPFTPAGLLSTVRAALDEDVAAPPPAS